MINLSYKFKKLKIYIRNKFHKKEILEPNDILIKKTIANLLSSNKTTINLFPITNSIYLQTENKEYTVILGENKVKITNHKLFIETYISDSFSKELTNMIYRCLDKRKTSMDNLITQNELDGLTYILNSLVTCNQNSQSTK